MTEFNTYGLPPLLAQSLEKMQYVTPTPIQQQAIPVALEGHDILGSAQTGTGKTAAFGIPLAAKLINNPRGSAIVLTPTRELAVQVLQVLKSLLGRSFINTALLIGGDPMNPQLTQLRARPRLIVGTPGRINDHLERGTLMLHDTSFLVLDETDRMLDMGFAVQLDRIFRFLPKTRQTLMFSATMPDNIIRMSEKYLVNPVRIAVGASNTAATNIKQEIIHTDNDNKYNALVKELETREGSVIVFVKTKRGADKLSAKLNKQKFLSDAIHGDLPQRKREKVISSFRDKKYRIMVATDIAARGLDIPHIEHVINFDLPMCPEDYIHRIGRTARAGAEGSSVCLITPEDARLWRDIERMMNPGSHAGKSQGGAPRAHAGNGGGGKNKGKRRYPSKSGDKPASAGGRSFADKREGGQRSEGQRSEGGRSFAEKRESGQRSEGGRSFADKREGGQRSDGGQQQRKRRTFRPGQQRSEGGSPKAAA